jgi:hypothetical protein
MDLSHKSCSYKTFLTRELLNNQLMCQENLYTKHGSQLCCILESIEKLLEMLIPGPHSKSQRVKLQHQSFFESSQKDS